MALILMYQFTMLNKEINKLTEPSQNMIFSNAQWYAPLEGLRPSEIKSSIDKFFENKDYTCIPAVLSYQNNEYMVGSYSGLGSGHFSAALHKDLLHFANLQKKTKSLYMSFWAVFTDEEFLDEDRFEKLMWQELSALCSMEGLDAAWDSKFSTNPADPKFCPSIGGDAFFVVGMHPQSSRLARKFKWPTLVFNLYAQFAELDRLGRYEKIIQSNRARDIKLQGSINPMVEKHGDHWESIQFSGKNNPDNWKCPFHRIVKKWS